MVLRWVRDGQSQEEYHQSIKVAAAQVAPDEICISLASIGPDLTNFTAHPDYLKAWLDNPAAVKPNTLMPDLDLSQAEIEALTAFINAPPAGGD